MSIAVPVAYTLHLLASIVWVGGMFFALLALRPAAGELPPDKRLGLWKRVFSRFFPWVWVAVIMLVTTGYWILFTVFGGVASAKPHVHVMLASGGLMALLYTYLWLSPWRSMQVFLNTEDLQRAAQQQARIRRIMVLNLTLGLFTAVIGALGRFL